MMQPAIPDRYTGGGARVTADGRRLVETVWKRLLSNDADGILSERSHTRALASWGACDGC